MTASHSLFLDSSGMIVDIFLGLRRREVLTWGLFAESPSDRRCRILLLTLSQILEIDVALGRADMLAEQIMGRRGVCRGN